MFAHRNVTRDIWRAVVVAGAMLGTGAAIGCSSASKPPAAEPETAPTAVSPEESTGEKRELGTGSALGESTPPPAGAVADAGVADAAPPDAAPEPKKRPRSEGGRPKGRGFIIA